MSSASEHFSTQHKVFVGSILKGTVQNEKQIGSARFIDSKDKKRFELDLWAFDKQQFYVVKNFNNKKYTIFAQKRNTISGVPDFSKPIGYGYTDNKLKEYLQLQINFPWQKIYLSLYPTQLLGEI